MSCALTCITWVHGISVLLGCVSTKFTWVARVAWVAKYFYVDKFFLGVSIFVFVSPTILHESILVTWIFFSSSFLHFFLFYELVFYIYHLLSPIFGYVLFLKEKLTLYSNTFYLHLSLFLVRWTLIARDVDSKWGWWSTKSDKRALNSIVLN